ncbi:MAG: DUF5915 domain-containing protein, partial [Nannocystaceae bacterium]
ELVTLKGKANFKTLGRRLGKKMKVIAKAIAQLDAKALATFATTGSLTVEGETLSGEDLLLDRSPKKGMLVASEGGITVALDTDISEELRHEGLAREVQNRVQNLRKKADLDVSQHIALFVKATGDVAAALARTDLQAMIKGETLADSLAAMPDILPATAHRHTDKIDGDAIELAIVPLTLPEAAT